MPFFYDRMFEGTIELQYRFGDYPNKNNSFTILKYAYSYMATLYWRILKYVLCLTSIVFLSFSSFSQQKILFNNNLILTTKCIYGSILPHNESMNYLIDDYQKGFELEFLTQTYGKSIYDSIYNFPRYGFGIKNTSLGSKKKLGNATMGFAIIEIPVVRKNKYELLYAVNIGITYAHKSLDKNIYNVVISNPLNIYIGGDIIYKYNLSNFQSIACGIDFSHISNGKLRTPNIGLNSAAFQISYSRQIKKQNISKIDTIQFEKNKKHIWYAIVSTSLKSDDFVSSKRYRTASFNLDYEFKPTYKYGFGIGTDFFYDASILALQPSPSTFKEHKSLIENGLHIGGYLHYRNISLIIQMGKYLNKNSIKSNYYSRLGLRYTIQHVILNFTFKSHITTADFIEFGLGYTIKSKK